VLLLGIEDLRTQELGTGAFGEPLPPIRRGNDLTS